MDQYVGRLSSAYYRELREIVELLCVMLLGISVFPGGDDGELIFIRVGQQGMPCILTES